MVARTPKALVAVGVALLIGFHILYNVRTSLQLGSAFHTSLDVTQPSVVPFELPSEKANHGTTNTTTIRGNRRPTTLVILTGDLRCGEKAWNSLHKHVLQVNHADLALLIGSTRPQYQKASVFSWAQYHWPVPDYDDWADAVDLIFQGNQSWRVPFYQMATPQSTILGGIHQYRSNKNGTNHNGTSFEGSVAVQMMIRYFASQKIQELNLTRRYQKFVITRADHYYLCDHDLTELANGPELWVPVGQDYHGYTDRHLVVSNESVLAALDIYPRLFQHEPDLLRKFLRFEPNYTNPESLLKHIWQRSGLQVERFPRVMFLCAVDGDSRSTLGRHWSKKRLKQVDVNLKYAGEYRDSREGCGQPPIPKEEWFVPLPKKKKKKRNFLHRLWHRVTKLL